jgi:S1-C subfamily serine protease
MKKTSTPSVALVAALAVAAIGCGGSSSEGATASKEPKQPSLADLGRSIVSIEGVYDEKKTQATGVIFDAKEGLVLTANHAMENAPNINVKLTDGTLTHARQVARAQCHDLAVLKLVPRPPRLSALALGDSSAVTVGQPITTLTYLFDSGGGNKQSLAFTRVQGTVSAVGVREAFPPFPRIGPLIAHQTPLLAAASGSPVLAEEGKLLGLNTLVAHPRETAVPGIEYALESNYIRDRLRQLRPGPGGALRGWGSEHDACHNTLQGLLKKGHINVPHSAGAK